ncbi:MAG: response regulator [Desulfuromonadales bacterium]|nr:response regulator [Desulfuromonadales bacterium]
MESSILLVDDEEQVLNALRRALADEPFTVCTVGGGEEALKLLASRPFKVVVCDERMPGMSGADLLSLVSTRHPEVVRIMLTGHATLEAAIQAVNSGEIYRFFSKPWNDAELILAIRLGIEKYDLEMENRRLLAMARIQARPAPVQATRLAEKEADGRYRLTEMDEAEMAELMKQCQVDEGKQGS